MGHLVWKRPSLIACCFPHSCRQQVAGGLLTWSVPVGFCLAGIFRVAQSYVLTAALEPQELTLRCSSPPGEPGNVLGIIANRWQSEDSNPEFCVYLGLTYCSDAGAARWSDRGCGFSTGCGILTWLRGRWAPPTPRWPLHVVASCGSHPGRGGAEPRLHIKEGQGGVLAPS